MLSPFLFSKPETESKLISDRITKSTGGEAEAVLTGLAKEGLGRGADLHEQHTLGHRGGAQQQHIGTMLGDGERQRSGAVFLL